MAGVEVELLEASGTTMRAFCEDIELVSTRQSLKTSFHQLNTYTSLIYETDAHCIKNDLVRDAVFSLHVSERLKHLLGAVALVNVALAQYKRLWLMI